MRTNLILSATVALALATGAALGAAALAEPGKRGPGAAMFERFDVNGDGQVTAAEFKQYRNDRRAEFDADGDGALNREEFTAMLQTEVARTRGGRMFDRLDADGDGKVTEAEFDAAAARMIERVDRDGDGVVTREEMASHRGPGHRGGWRGGDNQG